MASDEYGYEKDNDDDTNNDNDDDDDDVDDDEDRNYQDDDNDDDANNDHDDGNEDETEIYLRLVKPRVCYVYAEKVTIEFFTHLIIESNLILLIIR